MTEQRLVYLLTLSFVVASAGLVCLVIARLFAPAELHAFGGSL